jgi:hypothetical protein
VVANTTNGDVHLMAGPTPHAIYCTLEAQPFARGATVLLAAELDGSGQDALVLLTAGGDEVVFICTCVFH